MITDKYQLTLEENIFLAKRNIVDSIYKESRLEGIAITFPETNEIYEGRSVAGMSVDEIKEFFYENAISGINFEKKQDKKPLSKDEFYRKKVKSIEPKL
ncbi:hypothetical protein DXC84_11760 [Ruminococcus sp. TF08-4]|nr:hypothetical protein DXC84_11760 [Ruminococcus sp. TF08-4]